MLWYIITLLYMHYYHNRFYKNCSLERLCCGTQLRCPTCIIIIIFRKNCSLEDYAVVHNNYTCTIIIIVFIRTVAYKMIMLWYTVTLFYSHNYHNRLYKNCSLERSRCSTQLRCSTYIIIIFTLLPRKGMLPLFEPEAAYRLVRRTPVVPIACKTSPPRTEEVHVLFTCRKRLVKITYWICGEKKFESRVCYSQNSTEVSLFALKITQQKRSQ